MILEDFEKYISKIEITGIFSALEEAYNIHANVNQMYDIYDYKYHINEVFLTAVDFVDAFAPNHFQAILFGAAFHDTIEDARLTYNDVMKIAKKYMDDEHAKMATEIVYALTNEKGRTRQERANDKYYEGIRNTPYAPFVKLCDRYANMKYSQKSHSSMYKKYKDELPHFLESITSDNGNIMCSLPQKLVEEIKQL